jgi:hypothetical protein
VKAGGGKISHDKISPETDRLSAAYQIASAIRKWDGSRKSHPDQLEIAVVDSVVGR